MIPEPPRLLNVGCGSHWHPKWTNIDLASASPEVQQCDLRRGLPFDDGTCDVVYHSHLIEHLTPENAQSFLFECLRVLKPGGILRVAVPDLEGIARAYLTALAEAENTDDLGNLHWMRVELIDQMVRDRSGGAMRQFVACNHFSNKDFVRSRVGGELFSGASHFSKRKTLWERFCRIPQKIHKLRRLCALALVTTVDGRQGYHALREAYFRQSGEVHRWMYDRVTLCHLLREVGFEQAKPCSATASQIPSFNAYQLDTVGGQIRKPDSLFVEAVKPIGSRAQAAA